MLFLTDVVTPGKSTSNLETTVSESQSSHQQESQSSNQQDSQTSNQQDSQLSQSLLVQVDSYQSDDEVVHEPFNYDSSVDEIDLLTPASSHTVPGTSRSSSSSPRNKETWGRTRTPKRKRNMTPERAPSATEVALSFLKSTAQAQRKEDIPYAAGVFVKEVVSEFPRHKHPRLMLKLAAFLNKLKEEEGS
ncbi:uncharacterized protein [Macrobrachium rosenbergii]|uniref:uncharacterized protein isoform X2 n=1 Tax=Macrobrachium rosenbergii TaxID=79674 RepID=UPI0034D61968